MKTAVAVITNNMPPVKTFKSYGWPDYPTVIICDPAVHKFHREFYKDEIVYDFLEVTEGKKGLGSQMMELYAQPIDLFGADLVFRLDDDLPKGVFVEKYDYDLNLNDVIDEAEEAYKELGTSLVGFSNTSRTDWLGDGYKKTWGLITGAANLSITSKFPAKYMDPRLKRYDDVYRTLAHREADGAVGRVAQIGIDKAKCSVNAAPRMEDVKEEIDFILNRFPGMATCEGTRKINSGTRVIPNWRMKRDKNYR